MLTFIAFALTIAGCINWLLIGLLQYDFVAGIFGYQGSVFSRLIYIIVGASAVFLVVKLFLDKGSIHIWGFKKLKAKKEKLAMANANIDASEEKRSRHNKDEEKQKERLRESGYHEKTSENDDDFDFANSNENHENHNSLFDEHFDKRWQSIIWLLKRFNDTLTLWGEKWSHWSF